MTHDPLTERGWRPGALWTGLPEPRANKIAVVVAERFWTRIHDPIPVTEWLMMDGPIQYSGRSGHTDTGREMG